MRNKSKRNIHVHIIKHLREAHRLLGIWMALFLVFLAVTGILINHGNSLSLDTSHVKNSILLDHYGVKSPTQIDKYPLFNHNEKNNIFVVDNQVWYQQKLLLNSEQKVISAGSWMEFVVVVTTQQLHLFTDQYELVDVLDSLTGLPTGISDINVIGESVYLQSAGNVFLSIDQFSSWQQVDSMPNKSTTNFTSIDATSVEQTQLVQLYRQQMLSWEQVILDIHSGRFFGQIGVLLMDLVAILIIVLSLTGVYIWVRQARARRR